VSGKKGFRFQVSGTTRISRVGLRPYSVIRNGLNPAGAVAIPISSGTQMFNLTPDT